jgi:hypothetical protein
MATFAITALARTVPNEIRFRRAARYRQSKMLTTSVPKIVPAKYSVGSNIIEVA